MAARHLAPRQLEFLTSGKGHARGGPSLSASPVALRMGTAALRDAIAQKEIHARETQVRALENAQLKAQASGLAPVRPNRRVPDRPSGLAPVWPISDRQAPPDA